jgi:GDPmannose 4,6-dehydratase
VEVDPAYFRPTEVEQLQGNPEKARKLLGWNPTQTSFTELVRKMAQFDYDYVEKIRRS